MNSDILPSNYEQSLLQVATLASVKPTAEDVESLHAGLILQSLETFGQAAEPETLQKTIKKSTGIAIPIEAVVTAVGRLLKDGQIAQDSGFGVVLTPAKAQELRAQAEKFKR